jgi:hypothetical protein
MMSPRTARVHGRDVVTPAAGKRLAVLAMALALTTGGAAAKRARLPDVLDDCPSFLTLKPFAAESSLSDDDRLALADLRALLQLNGAAPGGDKSPPSIFNLGGLFVGINPGLGGNTAGGKFEPRTMFMVTRINQVNHEVIHRIRTPRYRFLAFLSQGPLTVLRFFGDSDIEVGLTGSPTQLTTFSVRTMADDPDAEREACDD